MTTGENSAVRSISERTRVGTSLAKFLAVAGAIAYGAWTVARYTATQESTNARLETRMGELTKKVERVDDQMATMLNRLSSLEYAVKDSSERRRR